MSDIHTRFSTHPTSGAERITAIYTDQSDLSTKQITRSYDYALDPRDNHLKVAEELDYKIYGDLSVIVNTNGDTDTFNEYILGIGEETKSGRGYKFYYYRRNNL